MYHFGKIFLAVLLLLCILNKPILAQPSTQLPKTFLWRISGNGLQKPSYLYGTIHITEKRAFFFGDSMYRALEICEGYAAELDMDSLSSYVTNSLFENKKSKLLKDVLDKETFAKLSKNLSKKLNIPANEITVADVRSEMNKTYRKSMSKGEMSGFMDAYLNNIAKKQGKWTGGIEDMEDQVGIDDDETTIDPEFILQQLSNDEEIFFNQLVKIYIDQDLQAIHDLYNGYSSKFKSVYLDKRNIKMAKRLDSLAHIRTMFFTMGVAHLSGDGGVIELLKQKGFTVEPVFSSKKISPDKYSYETVQSSWITNYAKDSSFSFKAPGSAKLLAMDMPIDMYMYMDLGTNYVYYVMKSGIAASIGNNYDSILNKMVDGMTAKTGKVISKKNILFKNANAIELLSKSDDGMFMRTIAFIKNKQAYIILFGAKPKETCFTTDVDYYFNSIEILIANPTQKITTINDTTYYYSAVFPGNEIKNLNLPIAIEEDRQYWNFEVKAFMDEDYSNLYIIAAKETKPGYYIPSDTALFTLFENQLNQKEKFKITHKGFRTLCGETALEILATGLTKDSIHFTTTHLIKNNRVYSIVGANLTEDKSQVEKFIQSFKLLEATPTNWQTHKNEIFSTWSPTKFNYFDTVNTNNFISFDKATTASYQVSYETLKPYQYWLSDTAYLNEQIKNSKNSEDSLVYSNISITNNAIVANVVLESPMKYNTKKFRFILHADTLFTLCAILPKEHLLNNNNDDFFNRFEILNKATTPISIFEDKAEKWITNIQSTDSATREQAYNAFYNITFYKKHLPALHNLFFTKHIEDENSYYSLSGLAENALVDLADSSTIVLLKQNYNQPNGTYNFDKAEMVNMLFRMKNNSWANTIAKELLLKQPPLNGKIELLTYNLRDVCETDPQFILKLMPLSKDSLWAYALAGAVNLAIDSNYIPTTQLLPFEENFIKETQRRLRIIHQLDTFNFEPQYYWLFGALQSFNTKASNAVLQTALQNKHLDIVYDASHYLLQNDWVLPSTTIYRLAENDMYRLGIYEKLKNKNLQQLFPKQFATQKMFARSYLKTLDEEEDYSTDSLTFIKEKVYVFKGKKTKFYLYKISFVGATETYLAIAGGFNLNASKLDIENYACGVFFDEAFDEENVDTFFLKFIQPFEEDEEDAAATVNEVK